MIRKSIFCILVCGSLGAYAAIENNFELDVKAQSLGSARNESEPIDVLLKNMVDTAEHHEEYSQDALFGLLGSQAFKDFYKQILSYPLVNLRDLYETDKLNILNIITERTPEALKHLSATLDLSIQPYFLFPHQEEEIKENLALYLCVNFEIKKFNKP
ncbi:MAG: hypothetical protein Q8S21_06725 [Candidatus Paracaedibacteraceae bacterium]|nr:hypothetical protein [Candidatus Paracaedibacteraceae bacterium]